MEIQSPFQSVLSSYVTGRAGVFIDESNLFHSQKTLKWRIDYSKMYWMLRDLDLGTRNIFVYTSFLKESQKQLDFIDKLVEYGYFVHSKVVKEIKSQSGSIVRKGNLDIELALDAYQFSHMYDTIVLFSGDSDFAYLLDLLKDMGKKIIVVSNKRHVSRELLRRGYFVDLNSLRFYIEKHRTTPERVVLDGTTSSSLAKIT